MKPTGKQKPGRAVGETKVLVAGSHGFIGSRLIPELEARGCRVTGFAEGDDATKPGETFDVFVNLAWRGSRGALRADYALQLDMIRTALDYYGLARRLGCRRFVCPGTIGERMAELPECRGLHSQNAVYLHAKAALHAMLRSVERPNECRVVWARLGNLYGPGDTGNLVNRTLSTILAGEEAAFGPARQPYEFVAARDCIRALASLALAPSLSRGEYYVGAGTPRELGDWLRDVGRIAGREDLVAIGKRPDDGTRYRAEWFDIGPLAADTGYRPETTFEDGVSELVRTMKEENNR